MTQTNIDQTICRSGYTNTIRPSESITAPEKLSSLAAYGDGGSESDYEYDHLVPLELGGAPNDPRNLWPEPGGSPNPKDSVENALHAAVCEGRVSLRAAQVAIARDWLHAGAPVPSAAVRPRPARRPGPSHRPPPATPATPAAPGTPVAEGPGSSSHAGDAAFCTTHECIPSFPDGHGTVAQCADGEWSHSGGRSGACSDHGGLK